MDVRMIGLFFISICDLTVIYGAGCGAKTIGGTSLGATYSSIDTSTGNGYLSTKYRVDCCGVITAWNVDIRELGTIHLQIWRLSGTSYKLVTSNSYTISTNDQKRVQTLTIDTDLQPTVLLGDLIGWYTTGKDMIPYKVGTGDNFQKNPGSTSGTVDFASGTTLNGREYAVNIVTGDNSAPRFTNLPATVSFLDTKSPVTYRDLYILTSTDDNKDDTDLTERMTTTNTKFILDRRLRVRISHNNWVAGVYPLDYKVTDQCENVGTGSLTIYVNNTNPVISNTVQSVDVREDINVETEIVPLTVTDYQTFTCAMSSVSPNDYSFVVKQNAATSAYSIYLLGGKAHPVIMDYDTKSQYEVIVACTDDLGLTTEKTFHLNVVRNEPPVINVLPIQVSKSTLTTTTGTQIYQINATDPENDVLQYTISCSPSTCPLSVNEITGEITANQDLKLHKTTPYKVYVTVSDGYRSTGPETLTVILTDITKIPIITNLGTTSLTRTFDENSGVGTPVYDVDFTDANTGETHTFSATFSPTSCKDMYTIDSNTGVVTTLTDFNYEDLLVTGLVTCDLIVTVNDGRESSTSKRLRVVVNDVNEQQTGFREALYYIVADEGQPGTVIQDPNFIVDDPDNNDVQTYTMDCGTRQTYFSLDDSTGIITQTREYDLDIDKKEFENATCTVTATDKGGNTVTTNLEIRINEINDNPPVLGKNKYDFVVYQTATAGTTVIGTCNSSDGDVKSENTEHTYSIDGSIIRVDGTCTVKLTADISGYAIGTQFVHTLTATDVGGLSDTATVSVVIIELVTTTVATNTTESTTVTVIDGPSSEFLDNPTDLAWFIPAVIALVVLAGLLGYMIYRFCIASASSTPYGSFNNTNAHGNKTVSSKPTEMNNGRQSRLTLKTFRNWHLEVKEAKKENTLSEVKEEKKNEPSSDKLEPKPKSNPPKPATVREPADIESKYRWSMWSTTDFSSGRAELR